MTQVIDLNAADPRLPADMLQLLRGGDELLDLARAVIQEVHKADPNLPRV